MGPEPLFLPAGFGDEYIHMVSYGSFRKWGTLF